MTAIQFNDEQEFSRPVVLQKQSTLVRLALSTGLVKTEKGANYLLIGFALLGFIFSVFMLLPSGTNQPPQTFQDGQSVIPPDVLAP
ncbi:MAG: hypothetical protein WC217_00310 [Candidatus Paceibacterota bacterium]|jgi:hypothetical protein